MTATHLISVLTKNYNSLSSNSLSGKLYVLFFICCLLFSMNSFAQSEKAPEADAKPLRVGLIPHLSTSLMLKKYNKLITYIEQQTGRPVIVNTAPDFKTFIKRSAEGKFDIYMTAPHMAAYHEKNQHHIRLARFSNDLRSVISVRADSPYKTVQDLRGKVFAAPDALAVNTINGEIALLESGLDPHRDITIKNSQSNNNPLILLSEGKVDAAISGLPGYNIVVKSGRLKQPLRKLKKSAIVPHMMFMSPHSVPEQDRQQFKKILLDIGNHKTGREFLKNIPFGHLIAITDQDMENLENLEAELEKRLNQ